MKLYRSLCKTIQLEPENKHVWYALLVPTPHGQGTEMECHWLVSHKAKNRNPPHNCTHSQMRADQQQRSKQSQDALVASLTGTTCRAANRLFPRNTGYLQGIGFSGSNCITTGILVAEDCREQMQASLCSVGLADIMHELCGCFCLNHEYTLHVCAFKPMLDMTFLAGV